MDKTQGLAKGKNRGNRNRDKIIAATTEQVAATNIEDLANVNPDGAPKKEMDINDSMKRRLSEKKYIVDNVKPDSDN